MVVNCTGLSAGKLDGVNDEKMLPARGQTVLVRNEAEVMCSNSGTDDGDGEVCYTMQRAAGKHHKGYQNLKVSNSIKEAARCLVVLTKRATGTRRLIPIWPSGS